MSSCLGPMIGQEKSELAEKFNGEDRAECLDD